VSWVGGQPNKIGQAKKKKESPGGGEGGLRSHGKTTVLGGWKYLKRLAREVGKWKMGPE